MRFVVIILSFIMVANTAMVAAQEGDPSVPPAALIEEAIGGQLNAFSDRDVDAAWDYASPMIKDVFGAPATFGLMVRRGYPMVWDNAAVRFVDLRRENGRLTQRISLRDTDGDIHFLDYEMLQTPDGWKINGVVLVTPDLST